MTELIDPRVQAAVHGAHHERWQRIYGRGPILAPRGLERLMPEPAFAVPALLEPDPDGRNSRSAVRALARSRSPVTRELVPSLKSDRTDYLKDYNGGPRQCRCDKAACEYQHAKSPTARAKPSNVLRHQATLAFDPVTWVSTATEQVIFHASKEAALEVIRRAFPQNWEASDNETSDFFALTRRVEPGAPDTFLTGPPPLEIWYLREDTQWQLNRDSPGGASVILEIEPIELQRESEAKAALEEGKAGYSDSRELSPASEEEGFAPSVDPVVKLHFKYRLKECLQTRFVVGAGAGGIGVDEGETFIAWIEKKQQLWISASKSVRFEGTRELSSDAASLLNLTAPATLSMLMQRLALDGPSEIIDALSGRASSGRVRTLTKKRAKVEKPHAQSA